MASSTPLIEIEFVQEVNIYDFKNDFNLGNVTFITFLTSPNLQAPALPTATPVPTQTPTPILPPSPSPTQQPTLEPSPTSNNTQEDFTPIIIITSIVIAAVIVGLLAYLAKYKGWK